MIKLDKYVYNEKTLIEKLSLKFIDDSEKNMGIKFPEELREFYVKYGYGFLNNMNFRAINRLMDPDSVAELRLRAGYYECDPELDSYEDYENRDNRLLFFEVNEGEYLTIQLGDEEKSPIYSGWIKIADSLEEFIIKMYDDGCYYWDEVSEADRRWLENREL